MFVLKQTFENIKVQFTKAGMIYKKDLAEILAIRVLQHFTSIVDKNIDYEVDKIEMNGVTDNYKVKLGLKTGSENIFKVIITYVFRKNSEIKAYATLCGRMSGSIKYPGEDTKFDIDDLGNAVLFDQVPDIHNKAELDEFVNAKLIPQCKKFAKEVAKIYKTYYY